MSPAAKRVSSSRKEKGVEMKVKTHATEKQSAHETECLPERVSREVRKINKMQRAKGKERECQ